MDAVSTKRVFMDMSVDEKPIGRLEIKLFTEDAPRTCENFRALCTGEVGMTPNNKARLHYKGSRVHRIVKSFMIQGGDITEGDGRGGFSIYGRYFDDEAFRVKHSRPYLVSMANKGPNTNSSQFFITTAPAPHCNGKHVVFGEVVKGQELVDLIDNLVVDPTSAHPIAAVRIENCGELVKKARKTPSPEEVAASVTTASDAKRRGEQGAECPKVPKSWLYRSEAKEEQRGDDSTRRRRQRQHEPRSRSPLSRGGGGSSDGRKVRGRGSVRYRDRSTTPEHWARNRPKKWSDLVGRGDEQ